jgi:hypothetical protein
MKAFETQDRAAIRLILSAISLFALLVVVLGRIDLIRILLPVLPVGILIIIETHRSWVWKYFLPSHNHSGIWIVKDRIQDIARLEERSTDGDDSVRKQAENKSEDELTTDKEDSTVQKNAVCYHLVNVKQSLYYLAAEGSVFHANHFDADRADGIPTERDHQRTSSGSRRAGEATSRPLRGVPWASLDDLGAQQLRPYSPVSDEWHSTSAQISEYGKHITLSYEVKRSTQQRRFRPSNSGTMYFTADAVGARGRRSREMMLGRYNGFDGEHNIVFGSMRLRRLSGVQNLRFPPITRLGLMSILFAFAKYLARVLLSGQKPRKTDTIVPAHLRTDRAAIARLQTLRDFGRVHYYSLEFLHQNPNRFWLVNLKQLIREIDSYTDGRRNLSTADGSSRSERPS